MTKNMLYFLHGDNQKDLKDYLFDLKKRAPLVEEFDARATSVDEFFARCFTGMLLSSQIGINARLIVVSNFSKSAPLFQDTIMKKIAVLARLPDVVLFYEEEEMKEKTFLAAFKTAGKIQHFSIQKSTIKKYDPLTPFLFGCANAWARGDRNAALRAAHNFFEQGGSAEALFFVLAAYVKKTKEPHVLLGAMRDQFIASRLEKADLRLTIFAFLSR